MLYSGKKIRALRDKKKKKIIINILTLVLSEKKKILNETKMYVYFHVYKQRCAWLYITWVSSNNLLCTVWFQLDLWFLKKRIF